MNKPLQTQNQTVQDFKTFPFEEVGTLATALIQEAYQATQLVPTGQPPVAPLPDEGEGMAGLTDTLRNMVAGSAGLAAPNMMGHMDTAAHPAAVFTDALVAALNNNLLFHEISPFASRVEEAVIDQLAQRLGLTHAWAGTFASGGSIANLTALFAAVGGFTDVENRDSCALFIPECAHTSIRKAAAILGIGKDRVHLIASDAVGRADCDALRVALSGSPAKRKIVVAVLGSTVHGAVEEIQPLAEVAKAYGAWLHIDAIYGGALAFSHTNRHFLAGLDAADSLIVGPQKWMYVPRVSAIVWVKGSKRFDELLGMGVPYSAGGGANRGRWGIQGSRRADALTLWAVLRYVGMNTLGHEVDRSIDLTQKFWMLLNADAQLAPTHRPDLNLLCFDYREPKSSAVMGQIHQRLGVGDIPWVSLSSWRDQRLFRAVLLSPNTDESHLHRIIEALQ